MLRVAAVSAAMATASAQDQSPAKAQIEGYSSFPQQACSWSSYTQGTDWDFASTSSDNAANCASSCDRADGCTGFEVGPTTSDAFGSVPYCALWFNGSCSSDQLFAMTRDQYVGTTFEKDAAPAADTTATTTAAAAAATTTTTRPMIHDRAPPTATTVEPTAVSDGLYVLKYPQQACEWAHFTEGSDWTMFSASSDATACAEGCAATESCTGFEVGSDAGGDYGSEPYCALWLDGACSVPDQSFYGMFSGVTGGYIAVDTYTLTEPIGAFKEFENRACAWAYFEEGTDWGFATKNSADEVACAKQCLDSADGCTGFEVGSSDASTDYGDLTQGYCALWYNSSCTPGDMLAQHTEASTFLLLDGSDCNQGSAHMYYFMLLASGLMICLMGCCCCRRAALRRRLAMQRAAAVAANAAVATRAVPGTAAVAAVAVEGTRAFRGTRAVVYAVQVGDAQEEPEK